MQRRAFVRMKKIFGWLQDGLYPNCSSVARDLEVCVKTVARDVDCLRDEWELPIGYDDKRHGFYFTAKVARLPKTGSASTSRRLRSRQRLVPVSETRFPEITAVREVLQPCAQLAKGGVALASLPARGSQAELLSGGRYRPKRDIHLL